MNIEDRLQKKLIDLREKEEITKESSRKMKKIEDEFEKDLDNIVLKEKQSRRISEKTHNILINLLASNGYNSNNGIIERVESDYFKKVVGGNYSRKQYFEEFKIKLENDETV